MDPQKSENKIRIILSSHHKETSNMGLLDKLNSLPNLFLVENKGIGETLGRIMEGIKNEEPFQLVLLHPSESSDFFQMVDNLDSIKEIDPSIQIILFYDIKKIQAHSDFNKLYSVPNVSILDINCESFEILQLVKVLYEIKHFKDSQKHLKDVQQRISGVTAEVKLLKTAFDHSKTPFRLESSDGQFIYQNQAFTDLFMYKSKEINGFEHGIFGLFHDQDLANNIIHNLPDGKSWSGEMKMITKQNNFLTIHLEALGVKDSKGAFLGSCFLCQNITADQNESFRNEKIIQTLVERELFTNNSFVINHYLENVHQDLRNIQKIKDEYNSDKNQQDKEALAHFFKKIEENTLMASDFVNELGQLFHSDHSNLKEEISSLKVYETIASQAKKESLTKGIDFYSHYHTENVIFHGNQNQVIKAIWNLITNSIDSISNLNEKWIKLNFTSINNFLCIEVIDSGPTITHSQFEKYSIPFFSLKKQCFGIGIGLNVIQKIVEDHNGKIELGAQNNNACIKISFPL